VQRTVALGYGLLCHVLFLGAVTAMAWSFYHGMTTGRGSFRGAGAVLANAGLLLQFPVLHSLLLSSRGRAFMARLAPLGLGRELATTASVILTAVQLILTFALWSPSGVVWWQAEGWQRAAMLVPFAGAWLLLIKSMNDSQLSLQTGFLGWSAVVRNRKPQYAPFATSGLYKRCRQPIYLALALILWTGSTWTPDQLVLAVGWTAYCVIGSALKERRFLRHYSDAFREYQLRVPFWTPSLSLPRNLTPQPTTASPNASPSPLSSPAQGRGNSGRKPSEEDASPLAGEGRVRGVVSNRCDSERLHEAGTQRRADCDVLVVGGATILSPPSNTSSAPGMSRGATVIAVGCATSLPCPCAKRNTRRVS
jgi:protein-S-isoprenylcysteine O-methyltransferase Ste14